MRTPQASLGLDELYLCRRRLTRRGWFRGVFVAVGTAVMMACGGRSELSEDQVGGTADEARRAYKDAVTTILRNERAAFETFFGVQSEDLLGTTGIAAAEPRIKAFLTVMIDSEQRARNLEAPAKALLFHGSFLELFDRFVGDAQLMLEAHRAGDMELALEIYRRLKRGALARLDFLDERLALIDG